MNSLPKTVTRQRRDCDLNPGPSAPESITITTWLPSHPYTNSNRVICIAPSSGKPTVHHKATISPSPDVCNPNNPNPIHRVTVT